MRFASIILAPLLAQSLAAGTSELSGRSLVEHCRVHSVDPAGERGQICTAFISGFIAGLKASDAATSSEPRAESFGERATRTRLGARLIERQSDICLDDSGSLEDLIREILAYAQEHPPEEGVVAGEFARAALRRRYACDLMENRR